MTTVVWDGSALAWDSQLTSGDVKLRGEKGRVVESSQLGQVLVVIAGDVGLLDAVCASVARGQDPATLVSDDTTVLLLTRTGLRVSESGRTVPVNEAGAWGSGMMAAYAGLHLGYGAADACKLGCSVDLYSSEPVHTQLKSKLRGKPRTKN